MNRGLLCFLVLGLANVIADQTYDNVGSETQQISPKISQVDGTVSILDKNKRGAVKITNADNPAFNHLSSSSSSSSGTNNGGFKPIPTSNLPPFRYIYNNNPQSYYQNPYLTYIQMPHAAAQIAAQYAFQQNPIAHFFQTPTQFQYVSAPTFAQVPSYKYQSLGGYAGNGASDAASASSAYATQAASNSQNQFAAASSAQASAATTSAAKQVPTYSAYQSQPLYYSQQPVLFFVQPQAAAGNFIYQQPDAFAKQQQLLNNFGGNRFAYYTPAQNAQLNYLVPGGVQQASQTSAGATSDLKTSDKTSGNTQHASASNVYPYGAKV